MDVSASRNGKKVSHDHCSSGWMRRRHQPVGQLSGVRRDELQVRLPQQGHRGSDRTWCKHDIGVDEHEHVAGGLLGELRAGVRLAEPTGGQR